MAAKDTLVHLWVLVEWDLWSKSMKSQILEGFRSFSERRNWLQLAENIFKYFSAPYSDANNLMISKKNACNFPQLALTILYTCVVQISNRWRWSLYSKWKHRCQRFPTFLWLSGCLNAARMSAHIKVSRDNKSLNVNFPHKADLGGVPIKPIFTPVLPN